MSDTYMIPDTFTVTVEGEKRISVTADVDITFDDLKAHVSDVYWSDDVNDHVFTDEQLLELAREIVVDKHSKGELSLPLSETNWSVVGEEIYHTELA